MIWNRLSIRWKLFFALVGVSLALVMFLAVTVYLSMQAGFSNYLAHSVLVRFDRVQSALERQYELDDESWAYFNGHPEQWRKFVRNSAPPRRRGQGFDRPGTPQNFSSNEGPVNFDKNFTPKRQQLEPKFGGPGPIDPLGIASRLALQDSDGSLIVGGHPDQTVLAKRELYHHGNLVGWLALYGSQGEIKAGDNLFLTDQLWMLLVASLLTMVLSAGAAMLLSHQFLKPIHAVINAGKKLANGEYSTRLADSRQDEFGGLIDQFNQLAETLETRDETERKWVSDTSHELKTPLALLKAQIEALQDGVRKPDANHLNMLLQSVDRLSNLVADLNILSNFGESEQWHRHDKIDLSALVDQIAQTFRPIMEDRGLEFEIWIESDTIFECDRSLCERLITNLLQNSVDYTDSPGRVSLTLNSNADEIICTIQDTLPAPASQSMDKLFDRFYREEESRNRKTGGSGLGLAICREIVLSMNGMIKLNESPMGGLSVEVRLPKQEQ